NPTAMILSAALMLDWLADRHGHGGAAQAPPALQTPLDRPLAAGLRPREFRGRGRPPPVRHPVPAAPRAPGPGQRRVPPTVLWDSSHDPTYFAWCGPPIVAALREYRPFSALGICPISPPTCDVGRFVVDGHRRAWFAVGRFLRISQAVPKRGARRSE